jgi:hypothetical protein
VNRRKKRREPRFATVCRTLPDRASAQRKSNDFRLSLCAALCCRLPLLVAPKGQEKGNVSGSSPRRRRSSIGEGQHASGAPQTGDWDRQWPQDLERLQKKFFTSTDQLVTLRMFASMDRELWARARRLGVRITTESNAAGKDFDDFLNDKLVGPDNTFNHAQGWPDAVWQRVKESGATVNVCARSDSHGVRQILECATLGGATCAGLADTCGSLTPQQ